MKPDLIVTITDGDGLVLERIQINNDSPAEQTTNELAQAIIHHIENRFEVLDD